jgi:hypothetical protein
MFIAATLTLDLFKTVQARIIGPGISYIHYDSMYGRLDTRNKCSWVEPPYLLYLLCLPLVYTGMFLNNTIWGFCITVIIQSGITSAIVPNTTAAGVLPLTGCHYSKLIRTLITSATTPASCDRKGKATLVNGWQSVTSFKLLSLLIENFSHMPSTSTREWLPQIAHFNINGKNLLSLKSFLWTRISYNRAGLMKQQKSFQGLAMVCLIDRYIICENRWNS